MLLVSVDVRWGGKIARRAKRVSPSWLIGSLQDINIISPFFCTHINVVLLLAFSNAFEK